MNRQVYAALEINDGEIRLIVGEFFNIRFNVLKVERVLIDNFSNNFKNDYVNTTIAIKKALENASNKIGTKIESVILCIPSIGFNRYPLRVKVDVEYNDRVSNSDINRSIKKALRTKVDDNSALVNIMIGKYYINGMTTRKMPINEKATEFMMDIDLLTARKDIVYEYVTLVEKCGVSILDVFLDTFAVCKEACLLEQTMTKKILMIKLERFNTSFSLLSNGKLLSSKMCSISLYDLFELLSNECHLNLATSSRLIKYNYNFNMSKHSDSPIYIWSNRNQTHTLSEYDIECIINDKVQSVLKYFNEVVENVFEDKTNAEIVIVGEGSELQGFQELLEKSTGVKTRNYIPETLGVRNGSLSAPLGAIYSYNDLACLKENPLCSVDLIEYDKKLKIAKDEKELEDESTITSKLKKMFDKKKEE